MPGAVLDWLLPFLGSATGVFIGTLVAARLQRSKEVDSPADGRALSVECWVRLVEGTAPPLSRRWRVGRAVISNGGLEVRLFRWGVRLWKLAPSTVRVEAVDRDAVQRSRWFQSLRFGDSRSIVELTTAGRCQLQVALRPDDTTAVLDILQGLTKPGVRVESKDRGLGRDHLVERAAQVVGWAAANSSGGALADDVADQLSSCWGDVQGQLAGVGMSSSDIVHVTVRTTDFPAARAHAPLVGRLLRHGGAAASIKVVGVDHVAVRGALVELEVKALQFSWSSGSPWEEEPPNAAVPEFLRAAVMAELDALVRGQRPEQNARVDDYCADGSTLIDQPEEVWEHPWSQASRTRDGVWEVVVPLWTTHEAPSDLSAWVEINPSGKATLDSVSS